MLGHWKARRKVLHLKKIRIKYLELNVNPYFICLSYKALLKLYTFTIVPNLKRTITFRGGSAGNFLNFLSSPCKNNQTRICDLVTLRRFTSKKYSWPMNNTGLNWACVGRPGVGTPNPLVVQGSAVAANFVLLQLKIKSAEKKENSRSHWRTCWWACQTNAVKDI